MSDEWVMHPGGYTAIFWSGMQTAAFSPASVNKVRGTDVDVYESLVVQIWAHLCICKSKIEMGFD